MAEIALNPVIAGSGGLTIVHPRQGGGSAEPQAVAAVDEAVATDPAAVASAVDSLKRRLSAFDRRLDFSIDQDLNRIVVRVIDEASGEVIRQIPPEEVLRAAKMVDKLIGILFDKRY